MQSYEKKMIVRIVFCAEKKVCAVIVALSAIFIIFAEELDPLLWNSTSYRHASIVLQHSSR